MFNWVKTAMLMAAITALFVVIGGMIGGSKGMMLALIVALAMNFFSYWFSDKLVLKMYNAQEVDEARPARRSFIGWFASSPRGRNCPCRRCISSTKMHPTRSQPGVIRSTRLLRQLPVSCECCPSVSCAA